ncbi:hypothetical protein PLESTB_000308100 [Pleodorina starrii]|uniref:Ankyrin repeat domain-containing protein n=1 Tax=Pleodorina starrii TaxID=330485 RepID=A0A9W6EYI3_9CHLO|nr:hypothetical protein PLESTB_000308100 [Pleodorina starrii]
MASNNLAIGAEALLVAGADPNRETEKPYIGERPLQIAQFSGAREVEEVLLRVVPAEQYCGCAVPLTLAGWDIGG